MIRIHFLLLINIANFGLQIGKVFCIFKKKKHYGFEFSPFLVLIEVFILIPKVQ